MAAITNRLPIIVDKINKPNMVDKIMGKKRLFSRSSYDKDDDNREDELSSKK